MISENREILISKYIDNELKIDEKLEFIRNIKENNEFYKEAEEIIKAESLLSFEVPYDKPLNLKKKKILKLHFSKELTAVAATLLLTLSFIIGFYTGNGKNKNVPKISKKEIIYRFVYYNPKAKSVALIGSFTNWKKIYLKKVGDGYWQTYVKLPYNKLYKYNFVINGKNITYDPSNPAKVYNGFGGFDSVIKA